jgi:hypothetical protein
MTDEHLVSLQRAATRVSKDPEHSRHGAAVLALPLIDAEIGRRTALLADPHPAPANDVAVSSDGPATDPQEQQND